MKRQPRLRQVATVKTTVRRRLMYATGATLAVAMLVGVGIFFYGNIGNNTESLANTTATTKSGNFIKNIFGPKGPSSFNYTILRGQEVTLTWLNGSDTKSVSDANGVLILRKAGFVTEDQSLSDKESDSAKYTNGNTINGWKIVYSGNLTDTYTDKNADAGTYTYLAYLKKDGGKYTSAKNAARTFVFNGNGFSETINTNAEIDGLNIPAGCSLTVSKNGELSIRNGASININGTLILSGDYEGDAKSWSFGNGAEFVYDRNGGMSGIPTATWERGSTCIMKGITNKVPAGLDQAFDNFTWDCKGQSTDLPIYSGFSCDGIFNVKSTGSKVKTLWLEGKCTLKGNFLIDEGTAKVNTKSKSNITFSGTKEQTIQGDLNLQTVTLDNTHNLTLQNTITVNKALNLVNGSLNVLGNPVVIADEAVITCSNGNISGNVNFKGVYDLTYLYPVTTGDELTTNATALRDLSISCSGNIVLNKTANINGTLSFNNGRIVTGKYEVNVKNTSEKSIKGFSSISYVAGNLRRNVTYKNKYNFPVGTLSNCELVTIDLNKAEGFSNLLVRFNNTKPDATPLKGDLMLHGSPVGNMLDYGYWTVTPNSPMTTGNCSIIMIEKGQANRATSPRCYCILTRDNTPAGWTMQGKHTVKTQSEKDGVVTAVRSNVTSFGDFGIGFSDISLLLYQSSFTATLDKKEHTEIVWRTSVEMNYTSLVVEKSQDAYGFEPMGEMKEGREKGSSLEYTFTDQAPFPGTSYYRIRQTDMDGRISYTDIKFIDNISKTNPSATTK